MEDDVRRLDCVSRNGNPLATLKWFKINGGHEQELSGLTSVHESTVTSELTIRIKATDNGAVYRCEASNRATTEPLSGQVSLVVTFMSSSLKVHTEPKHPKHGAQVKLVCETGSCNPMCEVTWTLNGGLLPDQVDEMIESQHRGRNTRSHLTITANAKQDQSQVVCRSFNKLLQRSVEKIHHLRVLRKS